MVNVQALELQPKIEPNQSLVRGLPLEYFRKRVLYLTLEAHTDSTARRGGKSFKNDAETCYLMHSDVQQPPQGGTPCAAAATSTRHRTLIVKQNLWFLELKIVSYGIHAPCFLSLVKDIAFSHLLVLL